jgi:hypothetical protein
MTFLPSVIVQLMDIRALPRLSQAVRGNAAVIPYAPQLERLKTFLVIVPEIETYSYITVT